MIYRVKQDLSQGRKLNKFVRGLLDDVLKLK